MIGLSWNVPKRVEISPPIHPHQPPHKPLVLSALMTGYGTYVNYNCHPVTTEELPSVFLTISFLFLSFFHQKVFVIFVSFPSEMSVNSGFGFPRV